MIEMTRENVLQAIYDFAISKEEIKEAAFKETVISILKIFGINPIPERLHSIIGILLYENLMIFTMINYREEIFNSMN